MTGRRLVARVTPKPKVAGFCAALWPDFTPPLTIAIGNFIFFARFGFSLFHGIDLSCSNKELINKSKFNSYEEFALTSSLKDAFLVDSFLIFLNEHRYADVKKLNYKRGLSFIINLLLCSSLIAGQMVVITTLANMNRTLAVVSAFIYFIMFLGFTMKIRDIPKSYKGIAERSRFPVNTILWTYYVLVVVSLYTSLLIVSFYVNCKPSTDFLKFSTSSDCFSYFGVLEALPFGTGN